MQRVLLTSFGPYGEWQQNASWLALQALLRDPPSSIELTTRLYPVDFAEARARMASDLLRPFDAVVHLGQAPGESRIALESFALNARQLPGEQSGAILPLEQEGPTAYRSSLPLEELAAHLQGEGIPAYVSVHAGTYLCNAALYWSHYFAQAWTSPARSVFVHLPLDLSQVVGLEKGLPSMPAEVSAHALRLLLERLCSEQPVAASAESRGTT